MFDALYMGSAGGQNLTQFFKSGFQTLGTWGSWIVGIIGVAMIIVAIYQIGKGLMSGGRGQTNWAIAIICLVLGGALAAGAGWSTIGNFTKTSNKTVDEMAQGHAETNRRTNGGADSDAFGAGGGNGGTQA